MRPLSTTLLCLTIGTGFWFALTTTLTDMTQRDCKAGVQRACDQLQREVTL